MPSNTNFNVTPYWDNYDPDDDFYRVLFRPGFAVQARELTTLQSILQNQIEQFGNHIFKEGSIVIPGSVGYDKDYYALKLLPAHGPNTLSAYLSEYVGSTITGETSGITAKVIGYDTADYDSVEPDTLYIKYVTTSTLDNTTVTFTDGESISADKIIAGYGIDVTSATAVPTDANKTGSSVTVLAGVYFVRGFMVNNTEQTIVLDKYSNTPSYRVGWDIVETFVTPEDDFSLLDNSQGSSNYAAKGAHRLKIELTLVKKSIEDTNDGSFIELIRVNEGVIEKRIKYTEYSVIKDMLARRTDEESGNYIVNHFDIEVRENLNNGSNRGVYTAENNGVDDKETLVISPGKAYVDGYEVDIQAASFVNLNKARTTKNIQNTSVPASLGNFVKVTNVYGQPDISETGSDIDPFKTVKLYDRITVTRGQSSGTHIGYARSRSFEYNSGTVGDLDSVYHHYIFDITMFNTIDVSENSTLTQNAIITGNISGTTAVVVEQATASSTFIVMQQKGDFITGETFRSSVTSDNASGAFLPTTNSTLNRKGFARDVKQIYCYKDSGLDYTSDIVLTDTITLGGIVDITGTSVSGFNTEFLTDLVIGDIISLATGASGVQESRRVVDVINNLSITLDSAVTNDSIKLPIKRSRTSIKEIEETILVYKLPKDNVRTLLNTVGQIDTRYSFRKQYNTSSTVGGVATFTLPAGQTWNATSIGRNYILTVTGNPGGTAIIGDVIDITGDVATGTGTNSLTITDPVIMGGNTGLELMGTVDVSLSDHRTKTSQKMTEKKIGEAGLVDIYGERVSDKEISLSYADVYKLHAIYESGAAGDDAVTPTLSTTKSTGPFIPGEMITGSVSEATGRIISDIAGTIRYVKLTGNITTLDAISGNVSSNVAYITSTSPGDKNIITSFELDTGQRDSFYDIGRLFRTPDSQTPTGNLLVVYDYFSAGVGDYFSVDSYMGQVPYGEIPFYTASRVDIEARIPSGNYPLQDCVDFRPRVRDQVNPPSSPFAYVSKDFEGIGSVNGNLVEPDGIITTDFDFYLPRKDLLYLDNVGHWYVIEGIPSEDAIYPATDNIDMLVGRIAVPAYTYKTEDVLLDYVNNKGYTMRDISKLETRIANLEYSTTLGLLERETDSYMILDGDGMNRFKSGFIVDNFYGHNVGHSSHNDYEVAVDPTRGHLRPVGVQTGVNLVEEAISDATRNSLGYQKTGDIITLKYTEVVETVQPYASRVESVNPYSVTSWIGHLQLMPETDVWMDDGRIPSITINVEGNYEQLLREQTEAGALGTVWNSWNTTWTGNQSGGSSSTTERNPDGSGSAGNLIRRVESSWSSVDVRQERTGMNTRLVERIDNISSGDRVTNIEVVPWIRSRDVNFLVTGMKPNTRIYSFFDGVDVNVDVKPVGESSSYTMIDEAFAKSATTLAVGSTQGFPETGTVGVGDTLEIDPWGVGFVKQEQMTYTGKTATSFTGLTRNTGNQYAEAQNWLAGTPVNDQTYGNSLVTDSVGTLEGRFKIPNTDIKRFRVGRRTFRLTDSSVNSKVGGFVNTYAEKEYLAIGHKQTKQELILATRNASITRTPLQETQSFTQTSSSTNVGGWYDPLAQSIMCDKEGGMFITSVDIFFSHSDEALPVWVEVRTMENGYPSQVVLPFSTTYLTPNEVNLNDVDGTTPTTFTFESPIHLTDGVEYCIVVASDSPEYKIWISRLGEIDIGGSRAISVQPTLGSLFKSQNASTWTASQYEDMKFTLKRAKFDTANVGMFTVINEEFTEADIDVGGGNGLIPVLADNPVESVIGENKVKLKFVNHANHDVDNVVDIRGIISNVNPTTLETGASNSSTSIICVDASSFPDEGTVRIDNELITYTGKSINTLTGCTRGTPNSDGHNTESSKAQLHEIGSIVNLHMFAGIPLVEINKTHIGIEDPELDSFTIATTTPATITTKGGGLNVIATKNVSYDVLQPVIQTMEFSETNLTASLQTTSGTTVGSTQQSFNRLPASSAIDIPLNEDVYFDSPNIICSPANEVSNLVGNKSLRLNMKLSSQLDNLSPYIDTQRMLAICVSSRLNDIDDIGDVNSTFTNYSSITESQGDNNAAIYITKKITLANSATALKIYFDAVKMSGSDIKVLYKIQRLDAAEPFEDLQWSLFTGASGSPDGYSDPTVTASKNIINFKEHQYMAGKKTNGLGNALDPFNAFAIKIVMQGNNSSTPPIIKDFRAIALAT